MQSGCFHVLMCAEIVWTKLIFIHRGEDICFQSFHIFIRVAKILFILIFLVDCSLGVVSELIPWGEAFKYLGVLFMRHQLADWCSINKNGVVKDCSGEQGHEPEGGPLDLPDELHYMAKSLRAPDHHTYIFSDILTVWPHFSGYNCHSSGKVFYKILECVSGNLCSYIQKSISWGQAPMLDEKAWLTISTLIPAKGVKWGWGQGSCRPIKFFHTKVGKPFLYWPGCVQRDKGPSPNCCHKVGNNTV